ncbi:OstA family protein [Sphingomonas colocasiae]|uniref:OstA family protein n=2 Tax=Sphingomonas colocasiae TaxID=1848973 RepID=A0ABS7PU43_9SPHN|nr:LptA/OstA family protein [Sphingomonas colocasiae]MBY8824781.1 OstA family protein [Sphingomonas colocasiae]
MKTMRTIFLGTLAGAAIVAATIGAPAIGQALRNHNASGPVDVEADRIEVQDRSDRAVFSGNVRVRQGGMTLDAARLTVAYANSGGGSGSGVDIQRLDASGGVVVRTASETARGSVAIYDLNRRLITMVGGVTLEQGANRVNGGRLVIDLNSGRSVIDGSAVGGGGNVTSGAGGRVTGRFTVPERKTN